MPENADPKTKQLLDIMNNSGAPKLFELPIEIAREALLNGTKPFELHSEKVASVEDITLQYEEGNFTVRIYTPLETHDNKKLPALIFYHGGGFMLGNIDGHDPIARYLCAKSGHKVINVDYRLAPEYQYPSGLHDCHYASEWVFDNADQLDIDDQKISLIGDSAGANLSAGVIQLSEKRFKSLILLYPCVDMTLDAEYKSRDLYGGGDYFLSMDDLKWILPNYAPHSDPKNDPLLSPIKCNDFTNWPPTLTITAGMDILRDEAKAFSEKLTTAGIKSDYISYEGTIHGFISFAGAIDLGRNCLDDVCDYWARFDD